MFDGLILLIFLENCRSSMVACWKPDYIREKLQALRLRYENLLEAHGEKIERIEELELDLADLKKLLKDQVTI